MALPRAGPVCRSPDTPSCSYRLVPACRNSNARLRLCLPWQVRGHVLHRTIRVHVSVAGDQGDGRAQQAAIAGPLASIGHYATAIYQFSRPHTMIGTALSVISISLLALGGAAFRAEATTALLQALVSALLMNIAIVGINQLYDIEIDKVNKPYLPLASGALTPGQGLGIVVATAAGSTLLGLASGSPALLATLLVSLVLGVLYSAELPFMRWKRSPVLAAGCILAVRAIIVQLGFYSHMRAAVSAASTSAAAAATGSAAAAGAAPSASATLAAAATAAAAAGAAAGPGGGVLGQLVGQLTPSVLFVIGFMLFFSVVIALFKDLPDVAGDRIAGVRTLSVRLGEGAVFRLCVGLLTAAYAWAMAASLALPQGRLAQGALLAGHAALCGALLHRARSVDTRQKAHLTDYYMFVWKLFYAEYLLIPLFG